MSIASRIESMYDHVEEVYDTITNVELNLGKNLFDISNATGTINGLTFSQYDGVLTINGTATQETNIDLNTVEGTGDTYSLSSIVVNPNSSSSGVGYIQVYNGETVAITKSMSSTSSSSGTLASGTTYTNRLNISNGQTYNNFQFKIQLEKGEEATPYQPYTDTPDYKNIENIPKTIKKSYLNIMNDGYGPIWNNWDKTTGSGTSVSLDNTVKAPMSLVYKGDTYQFQGLGKNIFNFNATSYTRNTTLNISDDTLRIDCSTQDYDADVWWGIDVSGYTGNITISYNTLTEGVSGDDNKLAYYFANSVPTSWNSIGSLTTVDKTNKTATAALGSGNYLILVLQAKHGNAFMDGWCSISEVQVELGSSKTSYERYIGNVPTPENPSEIQVVSGDNSIEVCGKNLLSMENSTRTYTGGISVTTTNNTSIVFNGIAGTTYYSSNTLDYDLQPGTYTISGTNNSQKYYFWFRDSSNNTISNIHIIGTTSTTFTHPSKTTKIVVGIEGLTAGTSYNETTNIQIEKGSTATTYEPYKGESYPISLGVENLWKPIPSATKNGVTLTYNDDGSYTLDGTATANSSFYVSASYPVGKYSLSINNSEIISGGADYLLLETSGGTSTNKTLTLSVANNKATFDITSPITTLVIVISSGKTYNNFVIKPQLEKGSKVNSFSKYGTTPIELCKIGTYQDRIFKTSGKNLFDGEYQNSIVGADGIYNTSDNTRTALIEIEPNTTYSIKKYINTGIGNRLSIVESATILSSGQAGTPIYYSNSATEYTYTSGANAKYLYVYVTNETSNIPYLMINKGSTALPYEPYGTGWYLKKEIGKMLLNGTENWQKTNDTVASVFTLDVASIYPLAKYTQPGQGLSNYFILRYQNKDGSIYFSAKNRVVLVRDTSYTLETFKTWLSNNNTIVYYVLDKPTYEYITDTTLLSQLEALKKSYEGQTNISQTNNDMPFELDVVALSDGTASTLGFSLGNPLSSSQPEEEEPIEEEPVEEE